jgi:hypothetical protein
MRLEVLASSGGRACFVRMLRGAPTKWSIAMGKLHYLVSAAAIAPMVSAFAISASAEPFSSVMGSWGYGGYPAAVSRTGTDAVLLTNSFGTAYGATQTTAP